MSAPYQLHSDSADIAHVLHLIRDSFAYMDGRVDPPSSVHSLDRESLQRQCNLAEVWVIGTPPDAAMILTPQREVLYLGKLAVRDTCRGRGLARALVSHAVKRAVAMGLKGLELETRVELLENQEAFARMGFREIAKTRHPGYNRDTAVTMRRDMSL